MFPVAGWGAPSVAAVLLSILALAALGCGDQTGNVEVPTETVRGIIVEVQAESLTEIDYLVLEDESGASFLLGGGEFPGFTPSHLREHMVLGVEAVVTFHRKDDRLVIDNIADP